MFLGNLSEIIYNKNILSTVCDPIKEGRMIVWYKLRDFGLDIDP